MEQYIKQVTHDAAAHYLESTVQPATTQAACPFPGELPLIHSGHDISMVSNITLAGSIQLSRLWPLPAS